MLDFASILVVVLPVYLAMATGGVLRKLGVLPQESDAGLMKLAIVVLSPCLILERVVGNEAVMDPGPVLVAASLGFGLVTFGILFSYFAGGLAGLRKGEGHRTFAVTCGMQNYGYVAIPIVTSLFPDKNILGVMFTFTLGVELACWTSGVGMLTGLGKAPWRLALNPPVMSILTALLLNFTGLFHHVPGFVHATWAMLGACAVPLPVVLIGAAIADVWGKERMSWRIALLSPILRQGILPMSFFAAAYFLPLSLELKQIIIVQGAMPSAVFTIMIARHYGGHAGTAVQAVLATTVVSIFTAPLAIAWGLRLIGSAAGGVAP